MSGGRLGDEVYQNQSLVVADHEHDGNELQVTAGFQTHVARKLGRFLDSCISEIQPQTLSCLESTKCNKDDEEEDEGFRLFSTSVPGKKAEDPPAPVRRRPAPSSSDSDDEMEMRLKEAAVSLKDLLPSSALSLPSTEPPCLEKVKTKKAATEGEVSCVVKKKKKRQKIQKDREQGDSGSTPDAQSNGELTNSEQEHVQVKGTRKKKKKRREGNTEEEALN
ncbi:protein CUSTOS isoform X2 [Archocentrus centrarchus]|uniref:protein CUSTOS isoform X2 n=1 Tax=Archocentrus centrarchus TaxID=63155 RepID=UPI0011E9E3C5|nr:protein CUSTOS isoform X2 [Archocentrus centrarchus]